MDIFKWFRKNKKPSSDIPGISHEQSVEIFRAQLGYIRGRKERLDRINSRNSKINEGNDHEISKET